ncbi:hypothetical protein EVAR_98393_1 [Eumeta japonica]|uniref:Uncharacterized protein n=1 Tax=Eumeta variegata TaxID=151549 RepID=A0A4C1XR91_EUMVA|nr:hypothetical protein EVAR_98393_1 [Eumeta japonica]
MNCVQQSRVAAAYVARNSYRGQLWRSLVIRANQFELYSSIIKLMVSEICDRPWDRCAGNVVGISAWDYIVDRYADIVTDTAPECEFQWPTPLSPFHLSNTAHSIKHPTSRKAGKALVSLRLLVSMGGFHHLQCVDCSFASRLWYGPGIRTLIKRRLFLDLISRVRIQLRQRGALSSKIIGRCAVSRGSPGDAVYAFIYNGRWRMSSACAGPPPHMVRPRGRWNRQERVAHPAGDSWWVSGEGAEGCRLFTRRFRFCRYGDIPHSADRKRFSLGPPVG